MSAKSTAEFNSLVISDLHLGEDLSPTATEANTLHIDIVERQLVSFIRHYARRREDGRPWRLIINGDMVDFLCVGLFPDHPDFVNYKADAEEKEFGLKRMPAVATAQMQAVVKRHGAVFRALARFLSRGNRVEIISGNHDTEFHWKGTQDALSDGIADAWKTMAESLRPGALAPDEVVTGLSFHPWFFYEPGVLWVEHGHQYDECCSLSHQLYPRCPSTNQIVTNVDTAAIRFVTSYVREADPQHMDDWSFMGYLRFGFGLGARGCFRLAKGYYWFSKVLLQVWRAEGKRGGALNEVRKAHNSRLEALAESWDMKASDLRKLDDLSKRPVVSQLRRLSAVLMVDKLVFYGLGTLIALLSILFFDGVLAVTGTIAGTLLGTGLAMWSGRGRQVDASATLELNPDRILRTIDAKFVTFGHTHEPVARKLSNAGWYFNTGTWVPTGKPGLLRAFTHLVVRHTDDGPEAQLCQWRDGASRVFTPGWRPQAIRQVEPAVESKSKSIAHAKEAAA